MILVPLIVAAILIAVLRSRQERAASPLAPATTVGRLALASVGLVVVVAFADAAVSVAVPSGIVMAMLAAFARWRRHDRGLLVLIPLTSGAFVVLLPLVFE